MAETLVTLGAGATKACNGPLTNEILSEVFLNKARRTFPPPEPSPGS